MFIKEESYHALIGPFNHLVINQFHEFNILDQVYLTYATIKQK